MNGGGRRDRGDLLRRLLRHPASLPLEVFAAVLAGHFLIARVWDLPLEFRKYTLAAGLLVDDQLSAERQMDFSPLYLRLAVAAVRLCDEPDRALEGIQLVLTAAAAAFLVLLVRHRFPLWLGWSMVVAFALDRRVLIYERICEPEICLLFFLLGSFVFLERTGQGRGTRWGGRNAAVAGILAAAAVATRPTFLPVVLLAPLFFRLRKYHGRRLLLLSTAFLVPVLLVVLALAGRAYLLTGDARTPVMNPGTVFFEGNNPLSQGTSAVYPPLVLAKPGRDPTPDRAHQLYREIARAETGEALSINEINERWARRALRFLSAEPGRAAELLLAKAVRIAHEFRWHDVPAATAYDLILPVPGVPFAALSSLALLGLLLERTRWREAVLGYVLAGVQVAVMLVFYVSARQQTVLLPALIYFAAVGVEAIRAGIGRSDRRRAALVALVLVVLMTVTLRIPNDLIRDETHRRLADQALREPHSEVRRRLETEPMAWNTELAVEVFSLGPWWIDWRRPSFFPQEDRSLDEAVADRIAERPARSAADTFDLAVMSLRAGRRSQAQALFRGLAAAGRSFYRQAMHPSDPLFFLGRIAALEGDRQGGLAQLERALARAPGDPFVLAELVALTDDPRYLRQLDDYFGTLDAQYLLGRALLVHGRNPEATAALGFVVRRLPEFREGKIWLAAALGREGRIDEGAELYLDAMRSHADPVLCSDDITELFRRWARRHPERSDLQQLAARTLHQHGRFHEALVLLEDLEPSPAVVGEREQIRRALRGR